MKVIYEKDYQNNMGILINLGKEKKSNALNITYDNLITNRKEILDKNKKYYITCHSGYYAKKACSILEYIGYDVTFLKHK